MENLFHEREEILRLHLVIGLIRPTVSERLAGLELGCEFLGGSGSIRCRTRG